MQSCADHRGYVAGCQACRREAREYVRGVRARRRGIEPEPRALVVIEAAEPSVGAVVAAVHADVAGLGELGGYQYLVEAALAMARILDDHRLATTAPAAAKQLMAAMNVLHREAAPKRGRLAAVQEMSGPRMALGPERG